MGRREVSRGLESAERLGSCHSFRPQPAHWSKEAERCAEQSWTQRSLQPSPAPRQKHEQEMKVCCCKGFWLVCCECYCGHSWLALLGEL